MSGPAHARPPAWHSLWKSPEASKVPLITPLFWIIKVLTTGMGEAMSDTLVRVLGGPVAVLCGFVVFLAAILWQFGTRRYETWVYWTAVSMVAVFGTMAADTLHVGLGIPYIVSSAFYLVVLATVFVLWYVFERTLSIHSITSRRREFFYWATVLATFALGTAIGDLSATTLKLGFAASCVVFAILITLPGISFALTRRHPVFHFWFAYVLTRPLGASVADYLGRPRRQGGVAFGTGHTSIVALVLVVALVAVMARLHRDVERTPISS